MKNKLKAFTLAEVLITLAIIGVVAAITIPSVVNHNKELELKTQRKKMVNVIVNQFNLMKAEKGEYNCLQVTGSGEIRTVCRQFYIDFTKFFYTEKICDGNTLGKCLPAGGVKNPDGTEINNDACIGYGLEFQDDSYAFVLQDGSYIFTFGDPTHPIFAFDVNGKKGPNHWGVDVFSLEILDGILDLDANRCAPGPYNNAGKWDMF